MEPSVKRPSYFKERPCETLLRPPPARLRLWARIMLARRRDLREREDAAARPKPPTVVPGKGPSLTDSLIDVD